MTSADDIIQQFRMQPLTIEGGFVTELYHAAGKTRDGSHPCASTIYYLMRGRDRSKWHTLKSDEIWFYHAGVGAILLTILPDGSLHQFKIGPGFSPDEQPQVLIPANSWQTAIPARRSAEDWAFFSTAVVPAFEYSEFTGAEDDEMLERYPEHAVRLREFHDLRRTAPDRREKSGFSPPAPLNSDGETGIFPL